MEFKAGSGAHINEATAMLLGRTFLKLKKEGPLTPKALLDASRPTRAPTHGLFEWDDSVAAEKHRLQQASYYLREVDIVYATEGRPLRVRAFSSEGTAGYSLTTRILKNPTRRSDLLNKAWAEFEGFRERWEHLEELAGLFTAAERLHRKTGT